jgi:hypothetical protein
LFRHFWSGIHFFKLTIFVNYSINDSIIGLANLKTYELKVWLKFYIKLNQVFIELFVNSREKLFSFQFDVLNTFLIVIDFSIRNVLQLHCVLRLTLNFFQEMYSYSLYFRFSQSFKKRSNFRE